MDTQDSYNSVGGNLNSIDIASFVQTLVQKWWLFVVCLVVFFLLGTLGILMTNPVYTITATMLIDPPTEETNNLGSNQFMEQGVPLFGSRQNLVNEITYLSSYALIKIPVEYLGFNVGYYQEGVFKDKELYKDSPFVVIPSDASPQAIKVPIYVKFLSEDTYEVSIDEDEYNLLHPDGKKILIEEPILVKQTCTVGEQCQSEFFSFLLIEGDRKTVADYPEQTLYFSMYDTREIASTYALELEIALSNIEGSVIEINSTGSNTEKEIDFVIRFVIHI